MSNRCDTWVPTPLDVLVESIVMKPSKIGVRILEGIVIAPSLPFMPIDIRGVCVKYLSNLPVYEDGKSIRVALNHLHDEVPRAIRPTMDVYAYAAYEKYRVAHGELDANNARRERIYKWIDNNRIEGVYAQSLESHLRQVHKEHMKLRLSVAISGSMSVAVHDVMTAMCGVIDHTPNDDALVKDINHLACIYDASVGVEPGMNIGRVFSYISRKSNRI